MIEVEIDKDVYLPCFHHIVDDTENIDIELIYGGRDSGKSKFVAQLLQEESLKADYFRCLLIKKTHNSIQGSQWQMLKDNAEQWKIDSLFKFNTSPLAVRCINRNVFDARGMEDPGKIRSYTNPSHAWIEEANQLSEEDFITIISGLRSDYGKVKLYMTFNPESPEPDYQDFWLYKMFFKPNEPRQSFTGIKRMEVVIDGENKVVELKYRATHVTYHSNPYVPYQRIALHESLAATNYYWYRVFTLGLWGNAENDSPYAYAFDRKKHVSDGVRIPHPKLNRSLPVILSWDFNRNPMTCLVAQHYEDKKEMDILEVIRLPKSGVDGMCEYILLHYPGCLFLVTGDYNGDNESSLFQEQITHYSLIQNLLNLSDAQIRIRPNPKQAKNSTHVNTVLSYYGVIMHGENAKALIFDCENVKRRADGTILKTDRDKAEQQADALDTMRYLFNEFLDGYQPDIEMIIAKANQAHVNVVDSLVVAEPKRFINPDSLNFTKFEYWHEGVRENLLKHAQQLIAQKDNLNAQLAMIEIKTLDELYK